MTTVSKAIEISKTAAKSAYPCEKVKQENEIVYFLWPPYVIGQAIIFLPCGLFFYLSIFFFSSPNLSSRRLDLDVHQYFYTWCGPSANLECRSEMCCMWLAGNAGPKKSPKIRHLGTITQLCRAISFQLRHVSTTGKILVKQQCLPHVSTQYGKFWPISG